MYTREILPPRASPVENGKLILGTWNKAFDEVDLLNVQKPYKLLFPRWINDCRIKEWESFLIQDDHFYLEAFLGNVKLYRIAHVFLYDKETHERFTFRKILPGNAWRLPRRLSNDSVESSSYGFFFRIHNWLDADTIKLDLDIEAARRRTAFTCHAEFNMDSRHTTPMAVSLGFSENRGLSMFKALSSVRGDMVFGGRHIILNPEKTTGLFSDCKGFYPYRMRNTCCEGMGFDAENRRYGFSIGENQTRETRKNNENALWLNGELSPLPPVRITMPEGIESAWIIQDIEGMVDLVFTPREHIKCGANLVVTNLVHETPLGYYNGELVSSRGEKIQVHNLWGLGERLYLRV